MNSKEIITKIIANPIKSVSKSLPKSLSVGLISMFSAIHLSSFSNRGIMAYAQQQQSVDPWSEALKQLSKVEAAKSPGAFGIGVLDLYNITTQELQMVFGITSIGSILVYTIINLINHREKIKSDH